MLPVLENLLILQDRDRKILGTRDELADLEPQRKVLQTKLAAAQVALDTAKHKGKQLESDRKKLELEVDAKKQLIDKYSLQQFQTKKNEEYRALAHEIEICREAIVKLEDEQLELMEQAEAVQKEVALAAKATADLQRDVDSKVAALAGRESSLVKHLAELEADRHKLAAAVEERALARYERLLHHKGQTAVVGIVNGVCGGCHMKLPVQVVITCQTEEDLVNCPNCGRILYFTRDLSMPVTA